jgi:hypothetical protein
LSALTPQSSKSMAGAITMAGVITMAGAIVTGAIITIGVSWSRLSEQILRVDKWSVCRG